MKIARLYPDAKLPTRKNKTGAGLDLYAYIRSNIPGEVTAFIIQGGVCIIKTGVTIDIPSGNFGWITNKSKSDYLIGEGVVDEDYQGELLVKVINTTDSPLIIKHGDAIAQLLIIPCKILGIEEVPLSEIHKQISDRGSTGGIITQLSAVELDPMTIRAVGSGPDSWDNTEYNPFAWLDSNIIPIEDDYDYARDDFNFDAARERRMK